MKTHVTFYRLVMLGVCIWQLGMAKAQFKNGDFTLGSVDYTITDWTNGNAQYVSATKVKCKKDPWVDLTGIGFGNGNYIEQSVYTVSGQNYRISFDLGTFFGWDLWDAGVSITLNGKPLGTRIYHDSFTYTQDTIIYWKRMSSIAFTGTGGYVNIRLTGDSRFVQSGGFNSGVGVIALDNVALDSGAFAGSNSFFEEKEDPFEFAILPNPVVDEAKIEIYSPCAGPIQYEICDMMGHQIDLGTWFSDSETKILNTKNWAAGTYIVRILQSQKTHSAMVMVAK